MIKFGVVTDVTPLRVMIEQKMYADSPLVLRHIGTLQAGDRVIVMSGGDCFIVIGVYND
ncbi:hypothetical protein FACS1894133_5030 [Clostridia bacterium]|nr:hypothetical protein FACS1894133_5030 [Clostridia bacterium]